MRLTTVLTSEITMAPRMASQKNRLTWILLYLIIVLI